EILCQVWDAMEMPPSIALIAVGGYGRRQLFPYSDIDLLVILPMAKSLSASAESTVKTKLEQWVVSLWDIGLEVGHSVRTLAECVEEANKDITVQTSMLEARWLAGNRQLFRRLSAAMQ